MDKTAWLIKRAQGNTTGVDAWSKWGNQFAPKGGWGWGNAYKDPNWRSGGAGFGVGAAVGGLIGGTRGAAIGAPLMALVSYFLSKGGYMPKITEWLGKLGVPPDQAAEAVEGTTRKAGAPALPAPTPTPASSVQTPSPPKLDENDRVLGQTLSEDS